MSTVIHWFRQDLRMSDNPALSEAARHGRVLPIYILDYEAAGVDAMGAASRAWLHHSLSSLNASLNGNLQVFRGNAGAILEELVQTHSVNAVFWNRCYEPWRIARDEKIKSDLMAQGVTAKSFNGSLLWEPWEIKKADGTPYRVFTPFYRKGCLNAPPPRQPISAPSIDLVETSGFDLEALQLLPKIRWDEAVLENWAIGEKAAHERLETFIETGLSEYKEGRNFPSQSHVSRLSPHLHFGELSPNQAWWAAQESDDNSLTFRSELGWREFSHSLLFHFPELRRKNWNAKFDNFPWVKNDSALTAWEKGQTGIPIIDAGMRELWQTGYMHNRVRMIVASFLIKNLLIDWRVGEAWFWDTLFDTDHANNAASWQWVAGSGADAAPYFRIFNPVTQGLRFDPEGQYVRKWVPEIAKLNNKYIQSPWEAPNAELSKAGLTLGDNYPEPIADLKLSRTIALEAFKGL